jgi:hypothetical protein
VAEYFHSASLEEHRVSKVERGKRTTTVYRWLKDVPLRDSADALKVTWFSVEILNADGEAACVGHGLEWISDPSTGWGEPGVHRHTCFQVGPRGGWPNSDSSLSGNSA